MGIHHPAMETSDAFSLSQLPTEILIEILYFLPHQDRRRFRFLNHRLEGVANSLVFRHVALRGNRANAKHFLCIARSEKLRPLIREITCDPWFDSAINRECCTPEAVERSLFPSTFLLALPHLQRFRNLKRLHVQFTATYLRDGNYKTTYGLESDSEHDSGDEDHESDDEDEWYISPLGTQSADFRYRVLDTVFQALGGTWSAERQNEIDETLVHLGRHPFSTLSGENPDEAIPSLGPIHLEALSITGLPYHEEKRLTDTDAFRQVLSSESLIGLRLNIARADAYEGRGYDDDLFKMYGNLPRTWLMPSLASHLKVLSLWSEVGCGHFWGWFPRVDFRQIRPQGPLQLIFPCLKVLALRGYVFSHEWQVDWVASLGLLEELYLISCPILAYATIYPSQQAHDTASIGHSQNDREDISSEGYLNTELRPNPDERSASQESIPFPLRWHKILSVWREKLTTLRIFTYTPCFYVIDMGDHKRWHNWRSRSEKVPNAEPVWDNATLDHLTARRNSPSIDDLSYWAPGNSERYYEYLKTRSFYGPYVAFDVDGVLFDDCLAWWRWGPRVWKSAEDDPMPFEDGLEAKDIAAFDLFTADVVARYMEAKR